MHKTCLTRHPATVRRTIKSIDSYHWASAFRTTWATATNLLKKKTKQFATFCPPCHSMWRHERWKQLIAEHFRRKEKCLLYFVSGVCRVQAHICSIENIEKIVIFFFVFLFPPSIRITWRRPDVVRNCWEKFSKFPEKWFDTISFCFIRTAYSYAGVRALTKKPFQILLKSKWSFTIGNGSSVFNLSPVPFRHKSVSKNCTSNELIQKLFWFDRWPFIQP